ncbi:uncharacterized protein LOC134288772 [Aedes albopictus]|uniref:Integrase catalytic domain-containing protein n=1 Tax=Aedes albopictus TaxID=7160 RepID=A0ABM1Y7I9_AEDAL
MVLQRNSLKPATEQTPLEKSSAIFQLCPILDDQGILRVDSRIGAAPNFDREAKFPVILPRKHALTTLLLDNYHRKYRHGNTETVVNEVRQRYYVPRLRTAVSSMAKTCQWCRVYKCSSKIPRMAPLPLARMASFVKPFTYTGLDFFGPLTVKIGRSNAKRWIAVFTCLTIRAVHVEVAHNLTTDSCIKCIRRFVCRRGAPAEIYSDNGTNFLGAARLLKEQVEQLAVTFTGTATMWVFNPPGTPHMGGAWERMLRSIKVAAETAYNNSRKLDDEALVTFMVEAESIVNSRPLTYLPLTSEENEAITPNHFLLGNSSEVRQPIAEATDPAEALRSSWHQLQHQLDVFWRRWIREYLPTLTKRPKWCGEVDPIAEGHTDNNITGSINIRSCNCANMELYVVVRTVTECFPFRLGSCIFLISKPCSYSLHLATSSPISSISPGKDLAMMLVDASVVVCPSLSLTVERHSSASISLCDCRDREMS